MKAKIIIVSWQMLNHETGYIPHLARFSGLPEPLANSGRAYSAWLDRVQERMPKCVSVLQSSGITKFKQTMLDEAEDLAADPAYIGAKPSKRTKGKAYDDRIATDSQFKASPKTKKQTSKKKIPLKKTGATRVNDNWEALACPVFQMFRFNRLVLDEWSYLDGKKGSNNSPAPILRLQAEKKWILSGTPPLRDFVDVKRMASFLGVNLGVDSFSSGPVTSQKWKTHRMEYTPAEQFNAFREMRTLTWHEDRHNRAQGFLDQFVRQNDAEIGEIRCVEVIVPFELRSDQRAVYLELLQHLKSNDMQVKSLGNNKSDRNERMRQALGKGKTPEEALLN
ncbi:hypothetical protein LTS18_015092, partial [Coniosporium uncinatum]